MQEIWKDIIIEKNGIVYDYTGKYQVSNLGRVKTLGKGKTQKQEKILRTNPNKEGYIIVALYKNGKRQNFYMHRLVANAFISNNDNLPLINHIDENPQNNVWTNLEWCDSKYNVNYGTRNERVSNTLKHKKD